MLTTHFPGFFSLFQDPHLNRFFQQCQKRELDLSAAPTSNFLNCLKVREKALCPISFHLLLIRHCYMNNQCSSTSNVIFYPVSLWFMFLLFSSFLFSMCSTSSASYASPSSRVSSVWRESQWSSSSCQCFSTSCLRFWLRMTMMRSLLPPPGRQWYYLGQNKFGVEWMW